MNLGHFPFIYRIVKEKYFLLFLGVLAFPTPPLAAATNYINILAPNPEKKLIAKLPALSLKTAQFNQADVAVKRFEPRGQTCLSAKRKCYAVELDKKVTIHRQDGSSFRAKRFNLLSLWRDHGYTTTILGYSFYEKLTLFPLAHAYVELQLNGQTQGLYLLVEKPNRNLKKRFSSPFVVRRKYLSFFEVKSYQAEFATYHNTAGENTTLPLHAFKTAYGHMVNAKFYQKGPDLYQHLKEIMDIDKYLNWLAINTLLRNGDFLDEIYFYAHPIKEDGKIFFDLMGWDPDDLFKPPHFGPYNTILARRQRQRTLLYSLESKLDRKIAGDPFLYQQYKTHLQRLLLDVFTEETIIQLTRQIESEIGPYLDRTEMIAMSRLDRRIPYTREYILNLLQQRTQRLIDRRNMLLQRIGN